MTQSTTPEIKILSSVCGKHFDESCGSCAAARQSNDDRIARPTPSDAMLREALEAQGRALAAFVNQINGRFEVGDHGESIHNGEYVWDREPTKDEVQAALQAQNDAVAALASPAVEVSEERVERVAAALYADWVREDFGNTYCAWDILGDKETWRGRARAAIAAMQSGEG